MLVNESRIFVLNHLQGVHVLVFQKTEQLAFLIVMVSSRHSISLPILFSLLDEVRLLSAWQSPVSVDVLMIVLR